MTDKKKQDETFVITVLVLLLLSPFIVLACHDPMKVDLPTIPSRNDSSQAETVTNLGEEVKEVKENLQSVLSSVRRLEAMGEVEAARGWLLDECKIYIQKQYRIANPVLYSDYEAGIEMSEESRTWYRGGCKIYIPSARPAGHFWKMMTIGDLWTYRKHRLKKTHDNTCNEAN